MSHTSMVLSGDGCSAVKSGMQEEAAAKIDAGMRAVLAGVGRVRL
jgi:hypothetical protein